MNFGQLQTATLQRLNNDGFWTAADVKVALNAIYVEVCEYTECFETETSLLLTPGLSYYDLETDLVLAATAEAVLIPLRIWNNQTSRWLDITTVSILDRERPRWGATGGEPDRWFLRGFSTLGVYPKPLVGGSSTSTLLIRHSAIPALMVADADNPEVPVQFQEVLELGAYAHLKGLEHESKIAAAAWQEYVGMRELLFDHVKNRTKLPHIPTYGGSQIGARR